MKTITLILLILVSSAGITGSQTFRPVCDLTAPQQLPQSNSASLGGNYKPERTDYSWNPSNAVFRVMIIFASFKDDPFNTGASYWPVNGAPDYMDDILAEAKATTYTNYWDAYEEGSLSDFWMEASRGHFHVIGEEYNVVLPDEYLEYSSMAELMTGIYDELLDEYPNIVWRNFDRWRWSSANSRFEYESNPNTNGDGYVDMIYVVHRTRVPPPCGQSGSYMPNGGIAQLYHTTQGSNHLIDPTNSIYINGDGPQFAASGLTMTPGWGGIDTCVESGNYVAYAPLNKEGVMSFSVHEMGHYLFGYNHGNYGKMSGAGAPYGVDECLSPWESIYMGYMTAEVVNYSTATGYSIGDFSSRNSNSQGEVLQVPVSGTNEFFLIANRQKVSMYDVIMWGDTTKGNPYFNLGSKDYGKGIYIYHTQSGYSWPPYYMDQECADGLWNWQYAGTTTPDWSTIQQVEVYTKTVPSYINDPSFGGTTGKDGKSMNLWFSKGKRHTCIERKIMA